MQPTVVFVATYDTKGVESDYIKKRVEAYGSRCVTIDVGVGGEPTAVPDVSLADLCAGTEYNVDMIHAMPRGDAVGVSSDLVQKYVHNMFANGECTAIIGIGGAPTTAKTLLSEFPRYYKKQIQNSGTAGDILSQFFYEDGRKFHLDTQYRLLAMPLEDLRNVKNVIALAAGYDKCGPIRAAAKLGYIKTLITDYDTANGILAFES